MSVAKVSEISATSAISFDDAIKQGLARANKTLRNVRSLWIKEHARAGRPRGHHGVPGQHDGDLHHRRLTADRPRGRRTRASAGVQCGTARLAGVRDTAAWTLVVAFHISALKHRRTAMNEQATTLVTIVSQTGLARGQRRRRGPGDVAGSAGSRGDQGAGSRFGEAPRRAVSERYRDARLRVTPVRSTG